MTLKRNWVHFVSESSGFDLISSLWQMNLLHVISQIFNSLDTSSLQSCNQISEEWCEILSHVKLQREKHVRRISLESNISSICLRDNSIVLGSTNGMVVVLDRIKMAPQFSFRAHSDPITSVCLLPNGNVVTGSVRGVVRLWKCETLLKSWPCHNDWVQGIKLSSSNEILTCSLDGTLTIISNWSSRSSAIVRKAKLPGRGEELVCLRPFEKQYQFLVGGLNGLWLVRRRPRQQTTLFSLPMADCIACDVDSPGLLIFAVGYRSRHCLVFSAGSLEELASVSCQSIIVSIALGGSSLFLAQANGSIQRWFCPSSDKFGSGPQFLDSFKLSDQISSVGLISQDDYCCLILHSTVQFVNGQTSTESHQLSQIDFGDGVRPSPNSSEKLTSTSNEKQIRRVCQCGFDLSDVDQTFHVFLGCPLFSVQRRGLMKRVSNILRGFATRPMSEQIQILLYGSEMLDIEQSAKLQEEVQTFAHMVNEQVS